MSPSKIAARISLHVVSDMVNCTRSKVGSSLCRLTASLSSSISKALNILSDLWCRALASDVISAAKDLAVST